MIYAIGDIHGHLGKLHRLLQKVDPGLEDRLIFLGDYVDRGPDSADVIEFLIRLKEQRPETVFLRGNHDQGMMDAADVFDPEGDTDLTRDDVAWWLQYGGRETITSYGLKPRNWWRHVPEAHWDFLADTALEYRLGGYAFVHAGFLPPGKRWFQREDPRLWVREEFILSDHDFGATVVFGHTPTPDGLPLVLPNKIGIDTGAAYGGPLTALTIDLEASYDPAEVQFVQSR